MSGTKRCVSEIDPTKFLGDQEKVFSELVKFIEDDLSGMALIQAPAGFGKTWLNAAIVEYLLFNNYGKIGVLAPTGQAVKVCRDNAPYSNDNVRYGTIHSAFAMRPKRDSDTLEFVQDKTKKVWAKNCDILFVDEVSQLADELFFLIEDYIKSKEGVKVIFSGDKFQIPPIGYKYSIPFSKKEAEKYGIKVFQLTQPIRQKYGNPILDNADFIREYIKRPIIFTDREDVVNTEGEKVVFLRSGKYDAKSLISDYFCSEAYKYNTHFIKILAWRNDTVNKWNSLVRKVLYGANPANIYDSRSGAIKKLVVGERLLSNRPVIERNSFTDEERVVFGTNEELSVESFVIDKFDVDGSGSYVINYYDTVVSYVDEDGNNSSHSISIVTEDSESVYKEVLGLLLKAAKLSKKGTMEAALLWKDYWGFLETFADISYDYAKTVHRGQGSTYENTIVLEWDIMENPDYFERGRILYVACTRPKKHLIQIHMD